MADESELVGGISVSLGASDAKLVGDLANAERLVQEWAKQVATVELRARFRGGTASGGTAPTGGGGAQAINQQQVAAIMAAVARNPAGLARIAQAQPRIVVGPGAATAAAGQQGQTALQRAINAELAKSGEVYDELTGEVQKVTDAHRAQRTAVEASTRSTKQNAEVETATVAKIDTSDLQAEIKSLVGALAQLHVALTAAAESTPAAPTRTGGGARRGPSRARGDDPELQALTAKLETLNNTPTPARPSPVGRTPANQTPEERARDERFRRDQAFADRANAPRPRNLVTEQRAASQRLTEQAFAESDRVRQQTINQDQVERTVRSRRAALTAGGQTGRTASFGLGALFGGQRGQQIEAQAVAAQATRQLTSAETAIAPLDDRLRGLARQWSSSTGEARKFNREQFLGIRRSEEYQAALGRVKGALIEDDRAQQRLAKFSAPSSIFQNLLAGAAGGAAYGLALQAAAEGAKLFSSVLGPMIDQTGNFGSLATKVTSDLAKQTEAFNGNVDAALAQAAVTARLSTTTSAFLADQLKLTTQVKAGAAAQEETTNLFRAGQGAGRGVPQGLGGGFGGIGGSALLAEQLGGQKGFQEIIAGGVRGFSRQPGPTSKSLGEQLTDSLGDLAGATNPFGTNFGDPFKQGDLRKQAAALGGSTPELTKYLDDLNAAIKRASTSTGQSAAATFQYTNNQDEVAQAVSIAKANGDEYGATLAQQGVVLKDTTGNIADFTAQLKALQQAATGKSIAPTEQLGALALAQEKERQRVSAGSLDAIRARQAFERPAAIAAAERQQQFSLGTQIPAQQALQNLANPLQPVGTGIVAANAKEQANIVSGQQRSVQLQDQLNAYYAQGKQILIDTYRVPESLINSVQQIGQEIASTQAGIRNEQAAYQVAQYNNQLRIARRTLADIGGLTGKNFGAGQSYLGQLEKENLALSRQAQLLQFAMSQRQINFQTALAGFQTPGVTPEEREARVKEAKIEAEFAQKQLDISKQIFGNQVQIVDISNLRQGADLAAQIGLLLQGRKVTIDTAQAEERLLRLQAVQAKNVAQVSTYLTKVDNLVGLAFSEIQQLELAAGKAMASVAQQVLSAYSLVIVGLTQQLNGAGPATPGSGKQSAPIRHASGAVGTTNGPMDMTIGEAGGETYAILRNPRAMTGSLGGGGINIGAIFGGPVSVRSNEDIEEIARKVQRVIGREGALKGLRGVG